LATRTLNIKVVVQGSSGAVTQLGAINTAMQRMNGALVQTEKKQNNASKSAYNMRNNFGSLQHGIGKLRNMILLYNFAIALVLTATTKLVTSFTKVSAQMDRSKIGMMAVVKAMTHSNTEMTRSVIIADELTEKLGGLARTEQVQEALKNLMAMEGMTLDMAKEILIGAAESAAFNAEGFYTMGEALIRMSQGLRMHRSQLSDSAGIQKNLSDMEKEYAVTIDKTIGKLTEADKVMAYYYGIKKEAAKYTGNLAIAEQTLYAIQQKLSNQYILLKGAIGDAMTPAVIVFTKHLTSLIEKSTAWAKSEDGRKRILDTSITVLLKVNAIIQKLIGTIVAVTTFIKEHQKHIKVLIGGLIAWKVIVMALATIAFAKNLIPMLERGIIIISSLTSVVTLNTAAQIKNAAAASAAWLAQLGPITLVVAGIMLAIGAIRTFIEYKDKLNEFKLGYIPGAGFKMWTPDFEPFGEKVVENAMTALPDLLSEITSKAFGAIGTSSEMEAAMREAAMKLEDLLKKAIMGTDFNAPGGAAKTWWQQMAEAFKENSKIMEEEINVMQMFGLTDEAIAAVNKKFDFQISILKEKFINEFAPSGPGMESPDWGVMNMMGLSKETIDANIEKIDRAVEEINKARNKLIESILGKKEGEMMGPFQDVEMENMENYVKYLEDAARKASRRFSMGAEGGINLGIEDVIAKEREAKEAAYTHATGLILSEDALNAWAAQRRIELEQEVYDNKSRLGNASHKDTFRNLMLQLKDQETWTNLSKSLALKAFQFRQMVSLEEVSLSKATSKILGAIAKETAAGILEVEAKVLEKKALVAATFGQYWKAAAYVAGAAALRTGAAIFQESAAKEMETDYLKESAQATSDLSKEAKSPGRTFGSATMPRVQNMIINVSMGFTGETILVGAGMSIEETSAILTDLVIGGVSKAVEEGEISVPA